MPAKVGDVVIYAGDTKDWPIYTFTDAVNQPRDLVAEGWTEWKAQWRAKPESNTAIDLVVDATAANVGIVTLRATSEQTTAMGGPGVWDLQAKRGDTVKTFLVGKTKYTKDVTRD